MIAGDRSMVGRATDCRERRPLLLILVGVLLLLPQLIALNVPLHDLDAGVAQRLVCTGTNGSQRQQGIYWRPSLAEAKTVRGRGGGNCLGGRLLPAQIAPLFFLPISINRADQEALMTIPGIGSRLAGAIIRQREREGGIKDQSALVKVEGVGPKKAEVIGRYVSFEL